MQDSEWLPSSSTDVPGAVFLEADYAPQLPPHTILASGTGSWSLFHTFVTGFIFILLAATVYLLTTSRQEIGIVDAENDNDNENSLTDYTAGYVTVYAASTENMNLSQIVPGFVMDDAELGLNQRILIKNQDNKSENGIYYVRTDELVRSVLFQNPENLEEGTLIFVLNGMQHGKQFFVINFNQPSNKSTSSGSRVSSVAEVTFTLVSPTNMPLVDPDNGENLLSLQVPAELTTSIQFTLPNTVGDANQVLTTDGNGTWAWKDSAFATSQTRPPSVTDSNYPSGSQWIDTANNTAHVHLGNGAWRQTSGITTGSVPLILPLSLNREHQVASLSTPHVAGTTMYPGVSIQAAGLTIVRVWAQMYVTQSGAVAEVSLHDTETRLQIASVPATSTDVFHRVLSSSISNVPTINTHLEVRLALASGSGEARLQAVLLEFG